LVEIKGNQRVGLECLPLESTPIYKVEIKDPEADIPLLAAHYPNAARALVNYTLHWEPGKHNRDALTREVEAIFPRWYTRSLPEIGSELTHARGYSAGQLLDVGGNVRRYLDERLTKVPYRDELLTIVESLLAEGVNQ
jgi:DNA repair protein SbcD/Mre11